MTRHLALSWFLPAVLIPVAALLIAAAAASTARAAEAGFNVLFIAVDDLRPLTGCYGDALVKTPNIDALAARGTLFNRAYCQQAVCSPSRTSLLTGRRPDTTRIYNLQTHFRLHLPEVVTLPQHFKQHGVHAQSFGKIYHGGLDDPDSWSVRSWFPRGPTYKKPATLEQLRKQRAKLKAEGKNTRTKVLQKDPRTGQALRVARPRHRVRGPSWEDPDVPDNVLPDGKTADQAIQTLHRIKDKRFFLAVGFYKPHLPFVAPRKYYDLYPPAGIRLPDNPYPPKDVPRIALTNWGELRAYSDIDRKVKKLSDEKARELIRGYYACTTYVDAQIGRVVDELDKLGLRDKTIIILWGDHGWQLGEHNLWCKHTNFELAARVPMLISAPRQKNPGTKTDGLVEFVDIYPTLCELAGLPIPEGLEGTSLVPLMDDPNRPWKNAAFSQYPRGKVMGYSIRTDRYRYTEWAEPGKKPVGVELYDHQNDPDENVNVASRPENREVATKLSKILHAGWRAALPPKK